jgi:hypothetical protein
MEHDFDMIVGYAISELQRLEDAERVFNELKRIFNYKSEEYLSKALAKAQLVRKGYFL